MIRYGQYHQSKTAPMRYRARTARHFTTDRG